MTSMCIFPVDGQLGASICPGAHAHSRGSSENQARAKILVYKRHVCPGSNTDAKAEAALSLGGWFSSPLPPLTFLIFFAKVLTLI